LKDKKHANHALARMAAETEKLSEVEASMAALNTKMFKLIEMQQSLQTQKMRDEDDCDDKRKTRFQSTIIDDELEQCKAQIAGVIERTSVLGTQSNVLEKRYRATTKKVFDALSGGKPLVFRELPKPNGADLSELRDDVTRIKAELVKVEHAPLPLSDARRNLEKWFDKRERRINVRGMIDNGEAPKDVEPYLPTTFLAGTSGPVESPDIIGILIGYLREPLLEQMLADLTRAARPDDAIADEAKPAKLKEIRKKLLAAERLEAAKEWQLIQSGEFPSLRADSDPRAILNCD